MTAQDISTWNFTYEEACDQARSARQLYEARYRAPWNAESVLRAEQAFTLRLKALIAYCHLKGYATQELLNAASSTADLQSARRLG